MDWVRKIFIKQGHEKLLGVLDRKIFGNIAKLYLCTIRLMRRETMRFSSLMKSIRKIYPFFVLVYLIPITYIFVTNHIAIIRLIVVLFGYFILLAIRHADIKLVIKEILLRLGIKTRIKSLNGEFSAYKKKIEGILKEHKVDRVVEIIDDERINVGAGESTIYINKGFAERFNFNNSENENIVVSVIGHELAHPELEKDRFKNLFSSMFLIVIFSIGFLIFGVPMPVLFYFFQIALLLVIFRVFRVVELAADKGGAKFAGNVNGLLRFLEIVDSRTKKEYSLWDRFDELFDYHPHPYTRIKSLENQS